MCTATLWGAVRGPRLQGSSWVTWGMGRASLVVPRPHVWLLHRSSELSVSVQCRSPTAAEGPQPLASSLLPPRCAPAGCWSQEWSRDSNPGTWTGTCYAKCHFTLVLFKPMSFREGSLKKGFERQSARREGKRYLPSAGSPPKGHSTQQFPVGQGPAPRRSLPVSHMGGRSPASVWSSVDCYQHLGSELVPRELCRIINKM